MSKTYRFSLVLLSAAVLFALSDSRSAFGQRFRSGGNSNQGNSEKKKDKDEEDKKDKKNRGDQGNQGTQGQGGNSGNNQGNQGNQGNSNNNQGGGSNKQGKKDSNNQGNTNNNQNANQNNNSNNPNASNSGKGGANKSGNSNVPSQFPPFIQGGRNQNDKDKDKDKKNKDGRDSDDQGQNLQGQGGRFLNPGRDGKPGNNQGVIIGPGGAGNAEQTNRKFGSWRGDRWEGSRKADHWTEVFGGKQKLFSSQWYKDHPQAFKYNNDKANVWVVASVPGIYSWLGWGAVPQQYAVGYGPSERFDASIYGEWYPLGVYSLMSGGDDMGTRVVQLAVDRHGHLSGNYYDMITNDDKSLSGEIDRQSQRVTFWLNRNPNVHFHASVYRLLQQPYGTITVHLPGAEQRWQFVRLED
jgi:hypothetical protein